MLLSANTFKNTPKLLLSAAAVYFWGCNCLCNLYLHSAMCENSKVINLLIFYFTNQEHSQHFFSWIFGYLQTIMNPLEKSTYGAQLSHGCCYCKTNQRQPFHHAWHTKRAAKGRIYLQQEERIIKRNCITKSVSEWVCMCFPEPPMVCRTIRHPDFIYIFFWKDMKAKKQTNNHTFNWNVG